MTILRRSILRIAMSFVALVVALALLAPPAPVPPSEPAWVRHWRDVTPGMSKEEVRRLRGEPFLEVGRPEIRIDHEGDSEPTAAAAAGTGFAFFGEAQEEYWDRGMHLTGVYPLSCGLPDRRPLASGTMLVYVAGDTVAAFWRSW